MKSVKITNANICLDTKEDVIKHGDLLIRDGLITKIAEKIDDDADVTIDAENSYVSAGFIDIHTHCYPIGSLGMTPDELGVDRWATAICDAGTSGPNNFEDFYYRVILNSKTKVFSFLNASGDGLLQPHELDSLDKINEEGVKETVKKYPETIIGLKIRASQSVVGKLGITPVRIVAELAHSLDLPVLVHVGNYPPALTEVIDLLKKHDTVTHAYHGKPGGLIQNGMIIPEAIQGRERGVMFDIGHGSESFSFMTYKKALALGFDCDSISSDLHKRNCNGPVYSIVEVVNKIINCGDSLMQGIDKVTRVPAENFKLKGLGKIEKGAIGDLMVFDYVDCDETVTDSIGDSLHLTKKIKPRKLVISRGEDSEIL